MSLYFRSASRSRVHLVLDHAAPNPLFGATGVTRIGLGVPMGGSRTLIGWATGRPVAGWDNDGPFFELDLDLGRRFGVLAAGSFFPGEADDEWGLGMGFRVRP